VANNASSWYLSSETHDDGLNDGMIKYFGDAVNAMVIKNQQASDVTSTLTQGIQQIKNKYQLK
jgi:hypothetical protein